MTKIILISVLSIFILTSCVKDDADDCPSKYDIHLYIQDKDYANSSTGSDLPFKDYVKNIYYTLENTDSENIIKSSYWEVSNDNKEEVFTLEDIPDGKYVIKVWGNMTSSEISQVTSLHQNNSEGTDLYLASDTLEFTSGVLKTTTIGLKRTKGKLVVSFTNLPVDIGKVELSISDIYQSLDNKLQYTGNTHVRKTFLKEEQSLDQVSVHLAPTISGDTSTLLLTLFLTDTDISGLTINPVSIIIKKNEVTEITVNYNIDQNRMEIWELINEEWVLTQHLEITLT